MARPRPIHVVAIGLLLASPAWAGDDGAASLKQGKALYDEAVVLLDEKKYDEACPKLEQAVVLVPVAVGARLALGECDEGRGRLASALSHYRRAEALAKAADQADREADARKRASAVEPRVATVRLALAGADEKLADLTVELDGRSLTSAERAAPLSVDAGKHEIKASAKGRKAFRVELDVSDAQRALVTVVLLEESAAPLPSATPTAVPTTTAAGSAPPWRTIGLVVGAVGLAGVGMGTATGAIAISKNDESYTLGCAKGGKCKPAGTAARNEAFTNAALSTGFFIGGGVLLAAGVVVAIVAPGSPGGPAKSAVSALNVRVSGNGLALEGTF